MLNGDSNSLSSFEYKASANPPPSIVYFSPDTAAKGDTVTITGINFSGTSAVSFGGTAAASFTVLSPSTIQAVVGTGTTGGVSVRTPNGLNTLPGFVYRQKIVQPVIRRFSPISDTAGGTVSIIGQYFTGVSSVAFGGTSAASFKVVNDTLIQAVVGQGSTGNVVVSNSAGTDSLAKFTYIGSTSHAPIINAFSPLSDTTGGTVTITGRYFSGVTAVSFGSTAATAFNVVNDTLIQAVVGKGSTGNVVISNPTGIDSFGTFTYVIPPAPIIYSFSPTSSKSNGTITIRGQHLTRTTTVSFGGVKAFSFKIISDSVITAAVSSGATGAVVVRSGQDSVSMPGFTYLGASPKVIFDSLSPASGYVGAVTLIIGKNLTYVTDIDMFSLGPVSYTILSDSTIRLKLGDASLPGNYYGYIVSGPDSILFHFKFLQIPPLPYLQSFNPQSDTSGGIVTIRGKNFIHSSGVSFGTTPAASFTIVSDSVITAKVGNGSSGYVGVQFGDVLDSLPGFTFIQKSDTSKSRPQIRYFSPQTARTGDAVNIVGSGFTGVNAARFGGVNASSFHINSDTSITAVVGSGASGSVVVTSASATDSLSGFTFIQKTDSSNRLPVITYFSPQTAGTGDLVNVAGANLTNVNAITFGSVNASSFHINSDSSITAVVGNGASGWVAVRSAIATDSLSGFTFIKKADSSNRRPQIQYFNPLSASKNETVTIVGSGFTDVKIVQFGDSNALSFVVNSDSTITAIVGNGASGDVKVSSAIASDSLGTFVYKTGVDTTAVYQLVQFGASSLGSNILLAWTAQNEKSIVSYFVEQSTDSIHFSGIGVKQSLGTDGPNNYVFNDSTPAAPMKYYRLKISNNSGAVFFSQIIAVVTATPNGVYPNPASGFITVVYPSSISESQIFVVDMSGRVVITVSEPPSTTQATINISRLRPGIYKIKWADWRSSFTKTVLVK